MSMTEDDELREVTEPWPDEAQKAEATATFEAFEDDWWREREERRPARADGAASPASSRPVGRAKIGRCGRISL